MRQGPMMAALPPMPLAWMRLPSICWRFQGAPARRPLRMAPFRTAARRGHCCRRWQQRRSSPPMVTNSRSRGALFLATPASLACARAEAIGIFCQLNTADLPHKYVLLVFTQIQTNVFVPLAIYRYLPPRAQQQLQQQQPLLVAEPHQPQPAALQRQQLSDGPPPAEALRARDSSSGGGGGGGGDGGRRGRLDSLAVDRLAWRGLLSEAASRRNAAAAAAGAAAAAASGGRRSSGGGSVAAPTAGAAAAAAATSSAAPSGSGAPVAATPAPGPVVSDAGAQAAPQLSPRAGRAATEGGGKPPVNSLQQHQSVRPWMALSMCVRWVWKLFGAQYETL